MAAQAFSASVRKSIKFARELGIEKFKVSSETIVFIADVDWQVRKQGFHVQT